MNLYRIEQRLRAEGYEEDEIDDTTSNLASDWYDNQKDYELEDACR